MSSRPLPGASYHTLETILHSFANVDIEAVGSLESSEYPSEKKPLPSDESMPLLNSRVRNHRGWPLLLAILVFFCLAFTASAFLGYSAGRWLMPDVPDRHVSIADHLSSVFHAHSHKTLVNEHFNGALVTLCVRVCFPPFFPSVSRLSSRTDSHGNFIRDEKLNCLRDECQELNVRDSILRTFPLLCVGGRTFSHGLVGQQLSAHLPFQVPLSRPYGCSRVCGCPPLAGIGQ